MPYYGGPWVKRQDDDFDYWGWPDGATGAVDMRAIAAQGSSDWNNPSGWGVFHIPGGTVDPDYTWLADETTDIVTEDVYVTLDSLLSVGGPPVTLTRGMQARDLISHVLHNHMDAAGIRRAYPVRGRRVHVPGDPQGPVVGSA